MEIVPMLLLFVVLLAREYAYHLERAEWAEKETNLLQRIQAPTAAVVAKQLEDMPEGASPVPIWRDEDAWELLNKID